MSGAAMTGDGRPTPRLGGAALESWALGASAPLARRAAGVLLHPTSLPGRYGAGELGVEAEAFLDFLQAGGQRLWQVLPLGPTGYGNSPYQPYSAFAGNPLLISLDRLVSARLLEAADLADLPAFPSDSVDFDTVRAFKEPLLRRAYRSFRPNADFTTFRERHASWLDDFALFMALKERHGGAGWHEWPPAVARREPVALEQARAELAGEIDYHQFIQFCFFTHYGALRRAAATRGVRLVGDLPIFVAYDSADVWANRELFFLDAAGAPTVVAGVPPDYFSATGQLWGNPLYRWDVMARDRYGWWRERLRMALTLYDIVRVDHFRGFEAYWEVPAGARTAARGRWAPGPGADFFTVLREEFGGLPIIAEDLGLITPAVGALRDAFGLPGMKVLQFAFSDPKNPYLPHNYSANCVAYTGTHDNDTTLGWWRTLDAAQRAFARRYLGYVVSGQTPRQDEDIVWDLIRLAFGSVAAQAIVPLQDLLGLGDEARMNRPGTAEANWGWRYQAGDLTPGLSARLRDITTLYGR